MAVTVVASAAASTSLLVADSSRRAVVIENSDANRLYVLLDDGTASSSNYSFSLATNENAAIPKEMCHLAIKGIWAADGTGNALITHL